MQMDGKANKDDDDKLLELKEVPLNMQEAERERAMNRLIYRKKSTGITMPESDQRFDCSTKI